MTPNVSRRLLLALKGSACALVLGGATLLASHPVPVKAEGICFGSGVFPVAGSTAIMVPGCTFVSGVPALNVNVVQGGSSGGGANGPAGSAGATAQYVQGIAGGVPIPISGTVTSTAPVPGATPIAASTTTGQSFGIAALLPGGTQLGTLSQSATGLLVDASQSTLNVNCATGCTTNTAPLVGGASSITPASGQTTGIAAYNASTLKMDALYATGNALNVHNDGSIATAPLVGATAVPASSTLGQGTSVFGLDTTTGTVLRPINSVPSGSQNALLVTTTNPVAPFPAATSTAAASGTSVGISGLNGVTECPIGVNGAGCALSVQLNGAASGNVPTAPILVNPSPTPAPLATALAVPGNANGVPYSDINPPNQATPSIIAQAPASTTGNLAALNAALVVPLNGMGGASVFVSGTYVGQVSVKGSVDPACAAGTQGTNFAATSTGYGLLTPISTFTANAANTQLFFNTSTYRCIEAIATSYTSGTATVTITPSISSPPSTAGNLFGGYNSATLIGTTGTTANILSSPSSSLGAQNALAIVGQNYGRVDNSGTPWLAQPLCINTVTFHAQTAATQLVALSSSLKIYVCSYQVALSAGVAATNPWFQFEYGTGTTCATGPVVMTGQMPLAANTIAAVTGGSSPAFATPVIGQALCLLVGGTSTSLEGSISYAQY